MSSLETLSAFCTGATSGECNQPGVYALIRNETIVYVGQSSRSMIRRVGTQTHYIEFDRVLFFAVSDRKRRLALEGALMRRLNPLEVTAGPKLGGEHDARVLARVGLTPDPDVAAAFIARQNARYTPEQRARAGRSISQGHRFSRVRREKAGES